MSYVIAILLALSGPLVVAGSLGLALIAGEATVAGLGLLAGSLCGALGALALIWCLNRLPK